MNPDGSYQNAQQKQLRLQDGECINMDGAKFKNMYLHRKMMVQKNMKANKMMKKGTKKPSIKKKSGKKSSK